MQKSRWVALVLALAFLPTPTIAEEPPSAYVQALREADALISAKDFKGAIKVLKKTKKLGEPPDDERDYALALCFNLVGSFKDGAKSAREAVERADTAMRRARAYNQLGVALFAGGKAGEDDRQEAVTAFEASLEHSDGELEVALFNLGVLYMKLERDEEGTAMLAEYLRSAPDGPYAAKAREYVEDPRKTRATLVPDFSATTLDGKPVSAAELEGKVVLLDFWGTWCAPCVASIPHLRKLSRRMENEPFVILSVSSDQDEKVLREFVASEEMSWPQVWDRGAKMRRLFGVHSFPTYILVDHRGEVLLRHSGWSSSIEIQISRQVTRALRALRKDEDS